MPRRTHSTWLCDVQCRQCVQGWEGSLEYGEKQGAWVVQGMVQEEPSDCLTGP